MTPLGALTLSLSLACVLTASVVGIAGEKRFVVENKVAPAGYPLWTSQLALDSCSKAVLRGTKADAKMFCETGFSGLKPKLGLLPRATEVELLDANAECGRMVAVRVLTGELKGEVGCVPAAALSSFKLE
jgi:hypothetical protein